MRWEERIMKSKTSFFNKTIFLKNFALFWPIWAFYTFIMIVMLDGVLFFGLKQDNMWNREIVPEAEVENMLITIRNATEMNIHMVIIFIAALVVGMALFNYLYSSKSANMLHSLPITRMQHFGTNVISGLVMLWVPQIIAFLIAVLICLFYGVTCINILGIWLINVLAISFIAYSMVVFCSLLTGQLFALPIYFFALNFLYLFVNFLVMTFNTIMSFGIRAFSSVFEDKFDCLSPMYFLIRNVGFIEKYTYVNEVEYLSELRYEGAGCLLAFVIVAIIFYAVAFYFYKKRDIENAGDAITVGFVKPIFKWSVGACLGYGGGMLIYTILLEIDIDLKKTGLFILCLVIGIICYLFAQMYIDKTFKVFKKRVLKGGVVFSGFMLVLFGILNYEIKKQENYIPDIDLVEEAVVSCTYAVFYNEDDIEKVIDLHNEILKDEKIYRDGEEYGCTISVMYKLKDQTVVERSYNLPNCKEAKVIYDKVLEIESLAENFKSYIYGLNYEGAIDITDANFEIYDSNFDYQDTTEFDKEKATILNEAILADINEGNLQKYNLYTFADRSSDIFSSNLYIGYTLKNTDEYIPADEIRWFEYNSYDYEYNYRNNEYYNQYIDFGPDCKNLINALIEIEAIDSVDDLYVADELCVD